jgi:dimethylaniline monooxygenase (N-oxide forming)
VRDIWKRDDPTIGFIGYVRPAFGAIPPLSELQGMLFVQNLLGEVKNPLSPEDEPQYRTIRPPGARARFAVDHDSYAYLLACDMDIAPTFTEVIRLGFTGKNGAWYKVPLVWAGSSNINVKFRMRGPWAWKNSVSVMESELWQTVSRRSGYFGKQAV